MSVNAPATILKFPGVATNGTMKLKDGTQAYVLLTAAVKGLQTNSIDWVLRVAYEHMSKKTIFMVVGGPDIGYTDEQRTFNVQWPATPFKVRPQVKIYVKLDDYGSAGNLQESMGKYYPKGLDVQHVLTAMISEEY